MRRNNLEVFNYLKKVPSTWELRSVFNFMITEKDKLSLQNKANGWILNKKSFRNMHLGKQAGFCNCKAGSNSAGFAFLFPSLVSAITIQPSFQCLH